MTAEQKLSRREFFKVFGLGAAAAAVATFAKPLEALAQGPVDWCQSYDVVPGDNLTKIAKKFRTSLGGLETLNPKITNPDLIHPNDRVYVCSSSGPSIPETGIAIPAKKEGESPYLPIAWPNINRETADTAPNKNDNYKLLSSGQVVWYFIDANKFNPGGERTQLKLMIEIFGLQNGQGDVRAVGFSGERAKELLKKDWQSAADLNQYGLDNVSPTNTFSTKNANLPDHSVLGSDVVMTNREGQMVIFLQNRGAGNVTYRLLTDAVTPLGF